MVHGTISPILYAYNINKNRMRFYDVYICFTGHNPNGFISFAIKSYQLERSSSIRP